MFVSPSTGRKSLAENRPRPGVKGCRPSRRVGRELGVPVVPILTLTDLLAYFEVACARAAAPAEHAANVRAATALGRRRRRRGLRTLER